ncbi:hypothetical protein BGZ88_010871 [Linnemannia elongata]|nr:hypothetical protein BGZ88_010871 [Linnemannia elongata]
MTNYSNKPNQENSQRRRANQPAMPPTACTAPTTAVPTVTIFITPFNQSATVRHVLQQQQQSVTHPTVYEDPAPTMNLQGDVDVDMFIRVDIEDDLVPHLIPPSRFDGKFGRPIADQADFATPPHKILSPSTAASLAYQKYPSVFNRPFDTTLNRPLDSTDAGSSSSAYQECWNAARQGDQAGPCLRPVTQEVIDSCLDQQQQDDSTPFEPQAASLIPSSSTAFAWPFSGQTDLGSSTPEPAKDFPSITTASNGQHGYKPLGPSFSYLTCNSNTNLGNSSFISSSSSSVIPTFTSAATTAPIFGQPSFPASVTQISATTLSPTYFVNPSNDIAVTAALSDAIRCPELSDALQRTIRKRLDRIRKEADLQDHHRVRAVQKRRRRRCIPVTDSGREKNNYSDEDRCCQSLPSPFKRRRRSSLPIHGVQSRKNRRMAKRMARRMAKKLQYSGRLNSKCRKMLSELELNERELQPFMRTLGEKAMGGVASAGSGRSTVFDSGLTAAEWVEAQGWMFSPSVDPLMVFTMHAPDQLAGDNEKGGTVAGANSDPPVASGNNTTTLQSTSSQSAAPITNTTSTSSKRSSLWRFIESVAPPSIIPSRSAATATTATPAETTASTTSTPTTTPLCQSPSTNNTDASTSSTQTPKEISTPLQEGCRARSPTRRPEYKRNQKARYFSQDEESNRIAATSPAGSHAVAVPPVNEPLIGNERTDQNNSFRGVAEAHRREEAVLKEEEAQKAALKRARRRVMRAQVRREEEHALLAEAIREQKEWDRRRGEVNVTQSLDSVAQDARQQWIMDQLEMRRIRDKRLDVELRDLMELERQNDEAERKALMEQNRMGDEREKRGVTKRSQMSEYDEDLKNIRPSMHRKNSAALGSTPASISTITRTPVLTRTTSYATGRDSTSTTNAMVLSVFESTNTAASTTCSSPVPDSPPSSVASEQELLLASPAKLSEAEQKREDMNHLADRNVEDLARRARAASRERCPSGSEESDTDSGQESQAAVKRRRIVDGDDGQQKQQDDDSAGEGSSSGLRRKTPQELQLERDEAFARELQDAEKSHNLSTRNEIDEHTVQQLRQSESQRAAEGVTGAGAGTGHIMTLEKQRLEDDMAMAKRMQQEEDDGGLQSDSKSNSIVRRKRSLRIIAQKERRLSSTSESTTPTAPQARAKWPTANTRSTSSAAKQRHQKSQKQQKPTRNPTRLLAASSSTSSTHTVQASSPSIQSAVETSPPPFSLPPPTLSSATNPRRITVPSLLTISTTPSPTGWDFPSTDRSSSRSPTRAHTSLYTPYKRPDYRQHSRRSSEPHTEAAHQAQSSKRSPQPEQSKEGLSLLADACEKAASLSSTSLSTSLSKLATEQVHQHHSTTSALAEESTNTTPAYPSNQLSPHAKVGSSTTATTHSATPADNGMESLPEEALPYTSRRSQRIQERDMNESVSKHLAEEKARKKEEKGKSKEIEKKDRKPRVVKEENKKDALKEATKKGRKPMAAKEEAKEEAEGLKPKGRKRKATEEASDEIVVAKKGRKPKAAKEEEAKEEVTEVKKRCRRPKTAKEEDTKEDTKEDTVVKMGRKPKTVTNEKKDESGEAKPKDRKRKATEEAKEEENTKAKRIWKPRAPKKDRQEEDDAKNDEDKNKRLKK